MIISQNLVDFLAPEIRQYGQTILDNSTYKFFFGTDGQDLVEIVKIYNLNQDEKAIISQKDQRKRITLYWLWSYVDKCKRIKI